ncbi:MAG: tetratricopeptide repeat protein, partial [Saprospiraceae bacterium]
MKRILFILFVSIISIKAATAQNMQLGIQYFQDGEYEKAAIIYKELWNKNKSNEQLLHTLTECFIALKDYDKALQVMNEAIQQNPNQLTLRITNAALLTKINKNDEAEKQYAYVLA